MSPFLLICNFEMHLIPFSKLLAARLGIGSTYRWTLRVPERSKNFFSRRKAVICHSNDLCYGNKGSWHIFKSCSIWSFWSLYGFNPVHFCLYYAAGVRCWGSGLWLTLSSALCKAGFTALNLRSFIIHSKEWVWAASCVMDGASLSQSSPLGLTGVF